MGKIKNFSGFMKLNESSGVATKIGSIKLSNGKTVNMFKTEVVDKDTKKTVIQPSFDIDGGNMTVFYGNGRVKSGLLQQADKNKIMSAFGAKDALEYNDLVAAVVKGFKEKGVTVSIQTINESAKKRFSKSKKVNEQYSNESPATFAIFVMNDGSVQIEFVSAGDVNSFMRSVDQTLLDSMKSVSFVEADGFFKDGRISIDPSGEVYADGEARVIGKK